MARFREIYRCEICGNIIEVLHAGKGHPVCCQREMTLLEPKTADAGREKHVPVVEKGGDTLRVKVGSVPHPMEEQHFIEWVDITAGGRVYRVFLQPGQTPEAAFMLEAAEVEAREYCTLHGLWKSS